MLILSIGEEKSFRDALLSYGGYRYFSISTNLDSFYVLPVLQSHEEYEDFAITQWESLEAKLNTLQERPVCVVYPTLESGVFLRILKYLYERFGKIDVILFFKHFTADSTTKLLSRSLYGVLYNFVGNVINKMYLFSFDIMRKLYPDLRFINFKDWFSKCASLFHKLLFYEGHETLFECTSEVVWDVKELEDIENTPKLVILTEIPLTEKILLEHNFFIYKVIYFIAEREEVLNEDFENDLEIKTEVLRIYKVYSGGTTDILEYYIVPTKI